MTMNIVSLLCSDSCREAPVLVFPTEIGHCFLGTDASDFGVGSVFSQQERGT